MLLSPDAGRPFELPRRREDLTTLAQRSPYIALYAELRAAVERVLVGEDEIDVHDLCARVLVDLGNHADSILSGNRHSLSKEMLFRSLLNEWKTPENVYDYFQWSQQQTVKERLLRLIDKELIDHAHDRQN